MSSWSLPLSVKPLVVQSNHVFRFWIFGVEFQWLAFLECSYVWPRVTRAGWLLEAPLVSDRHDVLGFFHGSCLLDCTALTRLWMQHWIRLWMFLISCNAFYKRLYGHKIAFLDLHSGSAWTLQILETPCHQAVMCTMQQALAYTFRVPYAIRSMTPALLALHNPTVRVETKTHLTIWDEFELISAVLLAQHSKTKFNVQNFAWPVAGAV